MKTYIALFEYEKDKPGFSVVFPDFPGLVTAGDDYDETVKMAHEGLSSHVNFLQEENERIPNPRTIEQIEETWEDWNEWNTDSCRSGAYPAPWGGKRVCTTECDSSGETTYPAACGGVVDCKFLVVPISLLPITTKADRINIVLNEGLLAHTGRHA
ncbi:MAG: hypothetical protein Ta2A_05570 [Treponemataceae bacterium]|nr:MAG: hypothetical protein Ta2A_05570 [Treponemataceae bacterium]